MTQQGIFKTVWHTIQTKTGTNSGISNETLQYQTSKKSGWMKKQGGVVKSWQRRWFTLKGDYLYYYATDDESKQPLGAIFLPGNQVQEIPFNIDEPDKFLLEVLAGGDRTRMTTTHETYLLSAQTNDIRQGWIAALRKVMYARVGGGIFGQSLPETMAFENRQSSERKVPLIVEQCVELLREQGMDIEGIFRLPGRSALVKKLKQDFDCGERPNLDDPEIDFHTVASLLKLYLRELPEPLIPVRFYESVMKIAIRDMHENPDTAMERLKKLLTNIPQQSYNILQYLCRFLKEVSEHASENKMPEMNLATVFVQSFIRPECDDPALLMGTADARTQLSFILITNCSFIFTTEFTAKGDAIHTDELLDFSSPAQAPPDNTVESKPGNLYPDLMDILMDTDPLYPPENNNAILNNQDGQIPSLDLQGSMAMSEIATKSKSLERFVNDDLVKEFEVVEIPDQDQAKNDSDNPRPTRTAPRPPSNPPPPPQPAPRSHSRSHSVTDQVPPGVTNPPVKSASVENLLEKPKPVPPMRPPRVSPPRSTPPKNPPIPSRPSLEGFDLTNLASDDKTQNPPVPARPAPKPPTVNSDSLSSQVETAGQPAIEDQQASDNFQQESPVRLRRKIPKPLDRKGSVKRSAVCDGFDFMQVDSPPILAEDIEDPNYVRIISMDVSGFTKEDLLTHVITLVEMLKTEKATNLSQQQKINSMKLKHRQQLQDMARKVDQEKEATSEAVDKVVKLQNEIHQYRMKSEAS